MKLKRNKFNLSHENKLTCDMGQLVPVMCKLALPGDKWRVGVDCVMRVAPLLAPLMHNVKLYFHTFSVPLRLLMNEKDWESFITGGPDGDDAGVLPYINFADGVEVGSLADYLGFPTNLPGKGTDPTWKMPSVNYSALPFRAYALIYNEWYRNQNLQDPILVSLEMGADTTTNTELLNRNWRKDYFTASLPSQMRGPQVYLPLGSYAAVVYSNSSVPSVDLKLAGVSSPLVNGAVQGQPIYYDTPTSTPKVVEHSKNYRFLTNLQSARGASVSDFRMANAVQSFMESQMRGGARYVETLMSQFGVRSSDARLQRPEYLGGGVSQLVVTPVLQTSSDTVSPQGNMAGQAFSAQRSRQFTHFFEEHSIIMTLMSIMPDTSYMQGTPREWLYKTRYDFPWPMFSHTSEQEVKNAEIMTLGTSADDGVFGYQSRYEEMRRIPSSVHGEFRSTLDYWHMGRIFAPSNPPKLNADFVRSDPTKRINAVTSEHNCWCDIAFNISALRPLPKQGVPSLKVGV